MLFDWTTLQKRVKSKFDRANPSKRVFIPLHLDIPVLYEKSTEEMSSRMSCSHRTSPITYTKRMSKQAMTDRTYVYIQRNAKQTAHSSPTGQTNAKQDPTNASKRQNTNKRPTGHDTYLSETAIAYLNFHTKPFLIATTTNKKVDGYWKPVCDQQLFILRHGH